MSQCPVCSDEFDHKKRFSGMARLDVPFHDRVCIHDGTVYVHGGQG